MELRQGTQHWEEVVKQFTHTFEFVDEQPTVDTVLQMIKEKIFVKIPVEVVNYHQCNATIQQWMDFYSMAGEPDDDPTNLNIAESEGMREVEGSGISSE